MKNFLSILTAVQVMSAVCVVLLWNVSDPSWLVQSAMAVWVISNLPVVFVALFLAILFTPSFFQPGMLDGMLFGESSHLVLVGGITVISLVVNRWIWYWAGRREGRARVPEEDATTVEIEPDQPRLGIIHLLMWVACVAVLFSVVRTFWQDDWIEQAGPLVFFGWACEGIARAAALGGLLLWAARRYRGMTFPRYPGEMLLVLLGIHSAMYLITVSLIHQMEPLQADRVLLHSGPVFMLCALLTALYFFAAWRTEVLRWRVYFFTVSAGMAAAAIMEVWHLLWWTAYLPRVISQGLLNLAHVILLIVAVMDAIPSLRRYPWTHWLGIGIVLSSIMINIMWMIEALLR